MWCFNGGEHTGQWDVVATVLLGPEVVLNAEAPSNAASANQWKLVLGDTILGSEVCNLKGRIPGSSGDLVQLEFGDLGRNEREEDEEQGEVLHGHQMMVEGGQEYQLGSNIGLNLCSRSPVLNPPNKVQGGLAAAPRRTASRS